MELSSGQNTLLQSNNLSILVDFTAGPEFVSDVDLSIFMLNSDEKTRTSKDFIFYNNELSGNGAVEFTPQKRTFNVQINKLESDITKLSVCAVIDGKNKFRQLKSMTVKITGLGIEPIVYPVDVANCIEESLILTNIYRHNGQWKIKALGQGFVGGLAPLATHFGLVVEQPKPMEILPAKETMEVSLQKKVAQSAPHLVDLVKPATVSLLKNKLDNVKSKVAFVFDASLSMTAQYNRGNVQGVLDRLVVLAAQFDDDGSMDAWGFAERHNKFPDITLKNSKGYINDIRRGHSRFELLPQLGGSNNEPPVMKELIDTFADSKIPVYVVFLTDGGISQTRAIKDAIRRSASLPIFWKFVGLGGTNYGILEDLDDFTDRLLDNSDFFHLDDFQKVSDSELYDRMLNEFSSWLQKAKQHRILA